MIIKMKERPVFDMLVKASGRTSFHMPGHKGSGPFGPVDVYTLDTTELPTTDDLYSAERGLREAEVLYARAAGAEETLMLSNGSTTGMHCMMMLYAREGDTVLLPRNAHVSASSACVLGGLKALWMPVTQQTDGYCYVQEQTVLDMLEAHPEAKAVLLTRPDYYGMALSLVRIVEKAHSLGIRVVVDEAHGAHYPWLDEMQSAGELGADAWVQSVHKTLPGLTGAAVLNLAHASDRSRAMRILRWVQTSSPSFLSMLSIDDARAHMEESGRQNMAALIPLIAAFRQRLPLYGYGDAYTAWQKTGQAMDPMRLVIEAPQGGHSLANALQARGLDVEMADQRRVVCILTSMTTPADLACLEQALQAIPATPCPLQPLPDITPLPDKRLELRAASMADMEPVPLDRAAGRISAVSAGLYPPGIPQVCAGEIIPQQVVNMLKAAGSQQRFGVEGDSIRCVKQ